jgi:UDP:flavonoid glycosyltransferase YjiC (YdhE family)
MRPLLMGSLIGCEWRVQNSLMEALYFKTPCIVIPFFGDQPENAARIEEIGCGSYLKKDHWKDPSELIMTINKYRQRSLQVQQALDQASASLRSCGGPEAGANKVLELTDLMTSHDDIFNMDIC